MFAMPVITPVKTALPTQQRPALLAMPISSGLLTSAPTPVLAMTASSILSPLQLPLPLARLVTRLA